MEVFGADFIIPKMHFMVHYAEFIRLLGPMRNYWCMRFEAKHQYFKKVATSINCFKDIIATIRYLGRVVNRRLIVPWDTKLHSRLLEQEIAVETSFLSGNEVHRIACYS